MKKKLSASSLNTMTWLHGKKPGTFQLSRFFSIASLITIMLAALVVSWMYRVTAIEDLKHQGELHNIALTRAFSNAIWPQMKYFLTINQRDIYQNRRSSENQLQYKTLHDSVKKLIFNTQVLKIEIYDLNRKTVYSTNEQDIGSIKLPDYPGATIAKSGQTSSQIKLYETFNTINGTVNERWIMKSYLPMHNPITDEINGVFEINTDITKLYQHIADSRTRFAFTVSSIFATVYLILFFLVRHADKILRQQSDEREQYLKEIKQINANLDQSASELVIAHDQAVEANSSKSLFLANMSHELRTPLNAIIGYSEMLVEDLEPQNQTDTVEDLKKIQQAGKHLLSIINEILDLSKIEAGKIELHLESFDVFDIVHGVSATIQPLALKNNNQFEFISSESLGAMYSDLTRLRQILYNLLSNACKFTKDGKITLRILHEGEGENAFMLFIVEDTGIGINPNQLKHIFDPFKQADSSTTREYGGTGLGLTISKRFCELLGGSILVESEYKKGTRFIAKLPISSPHENDENQPRPRLSGPLSDQFSPGNIDEDRRKRTSQVLVIDADQDINKLYEHFLLKHNFKVITAFSAEEGLQLAHQNKPDVILTDPSLPDMGDDEFLNTLSTDDALKSIPIIVLSTQSESDWAFQHDINDYIVKPANWNELSKTIRKWLRKNHQKPIQNKD